MKKFLIIASVICATTCFAHNVNEPLVCADTWHALLDNTVSFFEPTRYEDIQYTLTTDTILAGLTYRKLMRDDTICVGGLRQTDDGMKVYYYDLSAPTYLSLPFSHEDCLLYDFAANVGDSIHAYFREWDHHTDATSDHISARWFGTEKDTIDGRIYMTVARYYDTIETDLGAYTPQPDYYTRWIQGVGTPNVIWPTDYGLGDAGFINTLYSLCAMHGDESLYTFELPTFYRIVNNCTEWHFDKSALQSSQADNSPRKFLRDGQLLIETPLGIFNATGRLVE